MLNAEKEIAQKTEKSLVYDRYVWVDLDRTLVDPGLAMKRFYKAAFSAGVDSGKISQIEQIRIAAEAQGISFDPLAQLTRFDEQKFIQAFLEDNTGIIYPDSEPFMRQLRKNNIRFNILTYGVNSVWQGLKLKASTFNGHGLIIDTPNKLGYFAGKKDDAGNYQIDNSGHITAKTLTLIDDKPVAFYDGQSPILPPGCDGFLINRDPSRLEGKIIPEGVEVVTSLSELTVKNGKIVLRRKK